MKVAIYCRVSTEEQNNDSQEAACSEACARNGQEIYRVYRDVYTGAKESRPSFNLLMEDLRQGKFNAVMVTKLDRIGRSLDHLLTLFNEFNNRGINFIAITQNIDTTTSAGKLQFQILGAFAEFERNLISERTKEGLRVGHGPGKRGKDKKPRKRRGPPKKPLFNIETPKA